MIVGSKRQRIIRRSNPLTVFRLPSSTSHKFPARQDVNIFALELEVAVSIEAWDNHEISLMSPCTEPMRPPEHILCRIR
jgi:hypothetical protein